jgi:hypothetical protein
MDLRASPRACFSTHSAASSTESSLLTFTIFVAMISPLVHGGQFRRVTSNRAEGGVVVRKEWV